MSIEKIVIECAAQAYGVPADKITPATVIREELSNQSMKMVVFISGIEDELDVSIDLRDAAKLITVGDFIEKVKQMAQ